MKQIGVIGLIIGICLFFVGFSMDTSVDSGTSFGRVNNIGLMKDQQNIIIFSGFLAVISTLILVFSGGEKASSKSQAVSKQISGSRKCPFCAEFVKIEAVICRFCQKELPESPKNLLNIKCKKDISPDEQNEIMEKFGIKYDGEKFHFKEYKYDSLSDAVNYAKTKIEE